MKVRFFNAKNGDAIHVIASSGQNIVLDMGYAETYVRYMKKRIEEIVNNNQKVDLLIISHIDQDHISGSISFLQDILGNEFDHAIVDEIWHNSYRHFNLSKAENTNEEDYSILEKFKEIFDTENRKSKIIFGNEEISAKQGSTLAGLIYQNKIPWNVLFNEEAITGINKVSLGAFDITVLTPSPSNLNKLKNFWRNEFLRLKYDFQFGKDELFDDAYEFYLLNEAIVEDENRPKISDSIARKFRKLLEEGIDQDIKEDRSITNASSISLIIEENGRRILLTADAKDDDLFNALISIKNEGVSMDFDLVKLSHHGALKNNVKWLSLITSKYYVISTDSSKHNHPDIGSIANAIVNNKNNPKIICFNNTVDAITKIDDEMLMEEFNYNVIGPNKYWGLEIEI